MVRLDAEHGLHALTSLIKGSSSSRDTVIQSVRLINASWLCVLAGVALSMLGVASIDVAQNLSGGADLASEAWRQIVFVTIGMLAATVVALPHYRVLGLLSWVGMAVVLGLLVFLLLPFVPASIVTPRNGARGWINLGFTDFQPAELAKIAYVLVVARYLRFRTQHRQFRGLIVPGLLTIPPAGLITLQPDLGTAILFVPSLAGMLIAAGARLRHLVLILVLTVATAPLLYPLLQPHQKTRLIAMAQQVSGDRSSEQDINFQSFRAQTLIGAGQASGLGESQARAIVHYNRLPERHNDMIYAVIVARFGLVGGAAVIGLYLLWIAGALLVSASCREPFGRIVCVGFAGFITAQMIINIGMNVGLLPIIGITLPFVSYGGSSMVTTWLMTGLIVNVALHRPRPPYRDSFEYADDDEELFYATRPYGRSAGFSGRALTR
ncbi:MAG: FtsW/RodA/SpoVE family cell cycle protein [Phycisphaeraceae bacterium]|nr:FtsW/RodA/SpoVE family cell cycle protein [Phycisphaeraceae bacterium]MCW5763219.1 FtsW/RodA/SpoVE family cell cycle protein [Phycisphaeraceae bacterium]